MLSSIWCHFPWAWRTSFRISCWTDQQQIVSIFISLKIFFISPLFLQDFSLDIKFQIDSCFFSTLKMSHHLTTSFLFPDETWSIICITVLLYVIHFLTLAAFNILFFFFFFIYLFFDFQLFSWKCLGVIFFVFILRFAEQLSSLFLT